jgi:hypothetical protein
VEFVLKSKMFGQKSIYSKETLYFGNIGSTSSSKIGHDFKKYRGSKIEIKKKISLKMVY